MIGADLLDASDLQSLRMSLHMSAVLQSVFIVNTSLEKKGKAMHQLYLDMH